LVLALVLAFARWIEALSCSVRTREHQAATTTQPTSRSLARETSTFRSLPRATNTNATNHGSYRRHDCHPHHRRGTIVHDRCRSGGRSPVYRRHHARSYRTQHAALARSLAHLISIATGMPRHWIPVHQEPQHQHRDVGRDREACSRVLRVAGRAEAGAVSCGVQCRQLVRARERATLLA